MDADSSQKPVPPAPRAERRWPTPVLLWLLAMAALTAAAPFLVEQLQFANTRGRLRAQASVADTQLAKLSDTAEAFRWVARRVEPAVVHIDTEGVASRFEAADERSHLLGPREYQTQGQGSGVIIDADGYVLTNNHVIDGATTIVVQLGDGRRVTSVEVVGRDPVTDLAVLKIDADGLTAASWGDSERLEVGDWVLAIGNPFGLDRTVTAGIVSATRRRVGNRPGFQEDYLQTDAAINPGNSGGPLVNLHGEVIGINTAIVGSSYSGISFAIPSEIAHRTYEYLKSNGSSTPGWLGVAMRDVSPELAERLSLERPAGALVTAVIVDSPAERAGVKFGDVVLRWNDAVIDQPRDLSILVARSRVGSTARVVLLRDGDEIDVEVSVEERPGGLN